MKVKRLIIKNIGMIGDMNIPIDKALILFYGDLMQGKTTILNAVKWLFGGSFPSDIIKHGQSEAFGLLEFEGGSISREFYKAKDGSTKAREISFIRDGKPIKKPVDEIKKFLNPYLLDQDYLRKMTETERKVYFTHLFSVDTSDLDKDLLKTENDGRELRAKIKGYGEIDLTEVKQIDASVLKRELNKIREEHKATVDGVDSENAKIRSHNFAVDRKMDQHTELQAKADSITNEIEGLRAKLVETLALDSHVQEWIRDNPHKKEFLRPDPPNTLILESQIFEAAANEVRYEQYQKNIQRTRDKLADENKLSELEGKYKGLRKDKTAKLSSVNETCPIKDLSFDESGNFVYQGTTAGMLSGSQIERLSQELSTLYPQDLGLSLLDRGESLGRSIFKYVDIADKKKSTILATIVGDKPAEIPERVGVFVVRDGIIFKD